MKRAILLTMVLALLAGAFSANAVAENMLIIGGETEATGYEELVPGERIKVDGDYLIELIAGATDSGTRWLSDDTIKSNNYFRYIDTREEGAAVLRYEWPVGTHVPGCISIEFTNMTMESTMVFDRLKCQVVYDDTYAFDTTPMQYNPEQLAADGINRRSTDAVPVEPLIGVTVEFMVALPTIVRDSNKPLMAYITVDDSTVYSVNLRDIIYLQ